MEGKPMVRNYAQMFANCISLKNITFYDASSGHTNFILNGDTYAMFGNCRSLEKLDFSNLPAFRIENARSMFKNCYSLKELCLGQMLYTDD